MNTANNHETLELRPGDALDNSKRLPRIILMLTVILLSAIIWSMPPLEGMSADANRFLASLFGAVAFWMFDVFEDYIIGLLLLLFWLVLDVVPVKIALAGFSEPSWVFIIAAFGLGAAISKTSLLQRLAVALLRRIPLQCQRTYRAVFLSVGAFLTPLLPSGKARASVTVPISRTIADSAGFTHGSNGAAAITLAALIGFTQIQFLFLTGADQNLISWNLLPPTAKADFGWLTWLLASLPAAISVAFLTFFSIQLLLPLSKEENQTLFGNRTLSVQTEIGRMKRNDWIALATLTITVAGWLTTVIHGIHESWIALGALIALLLTGLLDKKSFRNDLDWGLILLFGILNSLPAIAEHLKIDVGLTAVSSRFLDRFAAEPSSFLLLSATLALVARFFLRKASCAALLTLMLLPLSEPMGVHPGILIITVLMSGECFLFSYQDGPYQIASAYADGSGFTQAQARKILGAKYLATLLAVAISIPYWRFLGFIR